ncbi:MAG TPA: hypothetical protein VNX40_15610 [Mucilaginibacter sp.]|jgi:hypothetical protein|nr:hypothetical protein [Mucilaginibacter sp.]
MEDFLKTLGKEDLLKLSAKVVSFVIDEIDDCNQKVLARALDVSTATVNIMANANIGKCSASTKFLRKTLNKLLTVYKVEIDYATKNPISIEKTKPEKAKDNEESLFTSSHGNKWRVMVHINQSGRAKEEVGLRYLIIHSKDDVDFLVGSDSHDDYNGSVKLTIGGKQAVFELATKNNAIKEVYIRFSIGNPLSRPSYLEGFLIHSYIDDNSMSGYTIIAQNISNTAELMNPRKMSFAQFKKYNSVVADFFRRRSTSIHCHSGVFTLDDLKFLIKNGKEG